MLKMPREFSSDLRWRVVFLHVMDHIPPQTICEILSVGKTFVHKVLKMYRETRDVRDGAKGRRGKHRFIDGRTILFIRNVIEQHPELYLDELRDWIEFETGNVYALSTVSKYLHRMGLSIKKLQIVARERDEIRRAEFRRLISQFSREQLLFIDESSKDERTFQRKYGLSLRGTRISKKGNFTRGARYSVLAAVAVDGVCAAHAIVGAYNRNQFEFAMEHFIVPQVGCYAQNEKCSVVVLDNCAIHYSNRVFQLIREKGGMVVFLPPYSPDMNPIELCFGEGKAWLQKHPDVCEASPQRCFEMALDQITQHSCSRYFTHCGYV